MSTNERTVVERKADEAPFEQPSLPAAVTPLDMLARAVDRGLDPDSIQKFMDLHDRWEAKQAKAAFDRALAAFKADPPDVIHDKVNDQYGSTYSSLANLVNTVNSALSKHGLSARWDYEQGDLIAVTCVLSHVDGHTVRVRLEGPPDESGKKNNLQKIRSTTTYLRAATFEAVTGIATHAANIDDDGNSAVEKIDEKQIADLEALIDDVGADRAKFIDWLGVSDLAALPEKRYSEACKALEDKRKRAG